MRKVFLFLLCSVIMLGGLYGVLFDLLYTRVLFSRLLIGAVFLVFVGGYLIWTDFVAPWWGIKTWED
jgi:predicted tellurium resistance membrane protein TerC